jgi:hypothetical protein
MKKINTSVYMMNKGIIKINNETDHINRLKNDVDISNKLSKGSMVLFYIYLNILLLLYSESKGSRSNITYCFFGSSFVAVVVVVVLGVVVVDVLDEPMTATTMTTIVVIIMDNDVNTVTIQLHV